MTASPGGSAPTGDLGPHVLREYALLADGRRGALVGPYGDICWMCAPGWESDALFSALIGGVGSYRVMPAGRFVWGGNYETGTLIWRSTWVTENGTTVCREALAYPGDRHRAVVLRRIEPVPAPLMFQVRLHAAAGFGQCRLDTLRRVDDAVWTAHTGALHLRISGAPELRAGRDGEPDAVLAAEIRLAAGEGRDLVLEISDEALPDELPVPASMWRDTETTWRRAVPRVEGTLADRDATHARAVLRGMTLPGGGMVAAATMSLPERAAQGRNYDYRYVWIRDQAIAGHAAVAVGADDLLGDAVSFASQRLLSDGPTLAPAYTLAGQAIPDEHTVDLAGYPGGYDVAGNHVVGQLQLDIFGETLLLFAGAAHAGLLDADAESAMDIAAAAIETRWQEPDSGIWELAPRVWAHSRLMCAAGLRAAAATGPPGDRAVRWLHLADGIVSDTEKRCAGPGGRWQRAEDDRRVDAALLLPFLRDAGTHGQARMEETMRAVERDLVDDFYVYRFQHDEGALADTEGAFLLCGFAMAMARHRSGDRVAAARYFERNRAACGPPGLFAEEYDVLQRQMRGNIPQAFVHAMLLESAARLAR